MKEMEPTECTKAEPPAAASVAEAPTSTSLAAALQSSMPTASDASAAQRNHPDASNGNSAFAVAVAVAATPAASSSKATGAVKEDRPSASTAVEHKVGGGGGVDSETKECKETVNSERASEAARSDSAGNNNFPKKASLDEEKPSAAQAKVLKQPTHKGKIKMYFMPWSTFRNGIQ